MIQRRKTKAMKQREIVGSVILCVMAVLFAFCAWQIIDRVFNPTTKTYAYTSIHYGQTTHTGLATTPKQMMSVSHKQYHHPAPSAASHSSVNARNSSAALSIAPITHRSSDAQVQHIGSGYGAGNGIWTVSSGQQSNSNRGIVSTATSVWSGAVSPVASRTLAYVEAPSGALSQELFAPAIRRAPPDEEDDGTNGPNIEQESPVGEGVGVLLLLSLLYVLYLLFLRRPNPLSRNLDI